MSAVDGVRKAVNEAARKPPNVSRDPQGAVSVEDRPITFGNLASRGIVVEITADGAGAHIAELARRCLGVDPSPCRQPGKTRVIVTGEPEMIHKLRLD